MSDIGFQRLQKRQTCCRRGHAFTPENTYLDKRGHRTCLTCSSSLDQRNRNAVRVASIKLEVLSHYSPNGVLGCSWETCKVCDIDMLTLDHVNNDGAALRKVHGAGGATYYYVKQHGYPEGYQTLCWNHQWKKEILHRHRKSNISCQIVPTRGKF